MCIYIYVRMYIHVTAHTHMYVRTYVRIHTRIHISRLCVCVHAFKVFDLELVYLDGVPFFLNFWFGVAVA